MSSASSSDIRDNPNLCTECIGDIGLNQSQINGPIIAGSVHGDVFYCQHYHQALVQPTQEADLNALWTSLKKMLQARHRKLQIPKMPWLEDWELRFKDCYVDLSITTSVTKERKNIQLQDIFKSKEGRISSSILIQGPAGYGKTTLLQKMCYDYGKESEEYIQQFELIILFPLREFDGSLDKMLIKTLQVEGFNEKNILDAIERNQSKVLILLDGFDELLQSKYELVIPLLLREKLPDVTLVVTSRHGRIFLTSSSENSSITELRHCVDTRLFIKGLVGEKRIQFLELYFKGDCDQKLSSITDLVERKLGFTFNGNEKSLFDCPLFLLLLVILSECADIKNINTITDLYKALFNFILRRSVQKQGEAEQHLDFFDFNKNDPPSYVHMLSQFGAFSLKSLTEGQFVFTEEEVLSHCSNDATIINLGLLIHHDKKCGVKRKSWVEPVHLTILEFCAAFHLWYKVLSATFFPWVLFSVISRCSKLGFHPNQSLIFSFMIGLCKKQSHFYFFCFKLYYYFDIFFASFGKLFFFILFVSYVIGNLYFYVFTFLSFWCSSSTITDKCVSVPLPLFLDVCKWYYQNLQWLACSIPHYLNYISDALYCMLCLVMH